MRGWMRGIGGLSLWLRGLGRVGYLEGGRMRMVWEDWLVIVAKLELNRHIRE